MMIGGLNPGNYVRKLCDLPNKDADLRIVSDGTKHFDGWGPRMSLPALLAPESEINQHHYSGSERQLHFPGSQMPPMTRLVPCLVYDSSDIQDLRSHGWRHCLGIIGIVRCRSAKTFPRPPEGTRIRQGCASVAAASSYDDGRLMKSWRAEMAPLIPWRWKLNASVFSWAASRGGFAGSIRKHQNTLAMANFALAAGSVQSRWLVR